MKITKRIHPGYTEWENSGRAFRQMYGKYQYIYSSEKGKISLIEFKDDFYESAPWEIYCFDGDLFDDVVRFESKAEAEKEIENKLKF